MPDSDRISTQFHSNCLEPPTTFLWVVFVVETNKGEER